MCAVKVLLDESNATASSFAHRHHRIVGAKQKVKEEGEEKNKGERRWEG